jgi:DME family drug/metabolite transporter
VLYLPAEAVAGFRFLIASIITSAIISVKGLKFSHEALKWLGIGAIFALIIGNYAFVEAIRVVNSARITPISATYPVIAAVFARLALKEALTINIVLGIFLSFIGVLLVVLS